LYHGNLKSLRHDFKIPDIVCHQGICLAIDGGFENHLIVRVPTLWPPEEMYFDRFDESGKLGQELVNFAQTEPVSKLMFRPFQHILVLQKKWRRSQRYDSLFRD